MSPSSTSTPKGKRARPQRSSRGSSGRSSTRSSKVRPPQPAPFCAKCGAALVVHEEGESTEAFAAPEPPDNLDPLEEIGVHGAALIVRSGGGRSGESFPLETSPTTIGRSPECAIFLDDVT